MYISYLILIYSIASKKRKEMIIPVWVRKVLLWGVNLR